MGMLALGLSYILVPMFALAESPESARPSLSCALARGRLLLAGAAAFGWQPGRCASPRCWPALSRWRCTWADDKALRTGMRRELGRSFRWSRSAGRAGRQPGLALALVLDVQVPRLAGWFGLCLIGVWLLSFLLGMLERILPFLGAMHAAGTGRRAPTPSALTDERALRIHFACHVAALAGLALALATDSAWIATAAALSGAPARWPSASFMRRCWRDCKGRELELAQTGAALFR